MSDSDDTDVLLLIPPDLFLVPSSSDSDISSLSYKNPRGGVISELLEQMQTLESRISAIESKDNSLDTSVFNNSLDSHIQESAFFLQKQSLGRGKHSLSQPTSLQSSPIKPQKLSLSSSLSVPSTPHKYLHCGVINAVKNDIKSRRCLPFISNANITNINTGARETKHDVSIPHVESSVYPGLLHVAGNSGPRGSHSLKNSDLLPSTSNLLSTRTEQLPMDRKKVLDMELSEVDELIQEMEATDLELSKRISDTAMHQFKRKQIDFTSKEGETTQRGLEFQSTNEDSRFTEILPSVFQSRKTDVFADLSLPTDDSFQQDDTNKIISEFKRWEQNISRSAPEIVKSKCDVESKDNDTFFDNINEIRGKKIVESTKTRNNVTGEIETDKKLNGISTKSILTSSDIMPNGIDRNKIMENTESKLGLLPEITTPLYMNNLQDITKEKCDATHLRSTVHVSTNTEPLLRSQKLLSLSDFWDVNTNKSQEEMFRIKLEEEKFRREHCEHLIQELQKRLLEHQEKVAVALRVDNEKNVLISQFHNAWTKLKQRVQTLEKEYQELLTEFKNVNEKHQSEVSEFQSQIKRCESELSKALDLAAGYKEKSDSLAKEKIELLRIHADELENSKALVQETEKKYDRLKIDYDKLLETNRQIEETLRNVQQELNRERFRNGEVRNEMAVIHKALDTCEAELTVLKQEKESLQLKVKEEMNRCAILEQKNSMLQGSLDEAKKTEKLVKEEIKSMEEQQSRIRTELQEVYQKQVDEVVKAKLQEFQNQLDSAEMEFVDELKNRQQVIAECAAKKIKEVIDKHRLEINLLEEKHKEEKRLCELQLAQAVQKSSILEMQLNSQRATKSQLAEQLHSVMQKQWQQALHIISGGNMESLSPLERINAEKFFESKGSKDSVLNFHIKHSRESLSLPSQSCGAQNSHSDHNFHENVTDTPLTSRKDSKEDLRKYIKLITEMQESREENQSPPPVCREVTRKHYMKKELSAVSEDSISWQPISEGSTHDCSEYISMPQKLSTKMDQQKSKPPWK